MIRTLIVLALGVFMALVVYAGQTGFDGEKRDGAPSPSRRIHESQVRGYDFSYRMVQTPGPSVFYQQVPYQLTSSPQMGISRNREKSQLVLFITDSDGKEVMDAKVKYRIMGPRKETLESGGFPLKGGYAAGIYCTEPGTYKIEAEIELTDKHKVLVDRFAFFNQLQTTEH
ncbi:MAG: hypothetical protein JXB25_03220 [Deltaproteobacteria bacterium]|nr:hypothetical protein [Deltaproteobacteria bacterium]